MSMTQGDAVRLVDFLMHALRHPSPVNDPTLDAQGWADVPDVLRAAKTAGFVMSRFDFEGAVREQGARRLVLSQDRRRVRVLKPVSDELKPRTGDSPSHTLLPAVATTQIEPAVADVLTAP